MSTYISPSASGAPAGLIYTSEAQRKALTAKMKRLWRRGRPKRKGSSGSSGNARSSATNSTGDHNGNAENSDQTGGNPAERHQGQGPAGDDRGVAATSGRSPSLDDYGGDDSGRADGGEVGDGGSDCDGEMMGGMEEEEGGQAVDRGALSRSLFDQILDQNAIPTIRQNSELLVVARRRFGFSIGLAGRYEFVLCSTTTKTSHYQRCRKVDSCARPQWTMFS